MLKQPCHVCTYTLAQGILKAEEALKANRMKICMAKSKDGYTEASQLLTARQCHVKKEKFLED